MNNLSQKQIWNAIAPEWYLFKDKHKKDRDESKKEVKAFLDEQTGNVLDLGAGTGKYLQKIKNGKMYLLDFSEEMLKIAKNKSEKLKIPAEFVLTNSSKLPFKDNLFNAAICIAVLHCVEGDQNRKESIKELYRVLKPGAKTRISVWNKNTKRFKNSSKERFVKWREKGKRYYYLYEPKEIYKNFKEVGFQIIQKHNPGRNIVFIAQKPK